MSWIWKTHGTGDNEESMQECMSTPFWSFRTVTDAHYTSPALRIEWCKARARAHRWEEECLLLLEEMRRVLVFWEWEADQWRKRAETVGFEERYMSPANIEGRMAYALRQALIRSNMIAYCRNAWKDVPTYASLTLT